MSGALCGLFAGFMEAIFVTTPMETVKVKFIDDWTSSRKPRYPGFLSGVSMMIKEERFLLYSSNFLRVKRNLQRIISDRYEAIK